MTIRVRAILFVCLQFFLLAVCLFSLFNYALIKDYEDLEARDTIRNMTRVHEAFRAQLRELEIKAEEWGYWDDTLDFLLGGNANYKISNLTVESLNQLQLSHFIIIDINRNIHTEIEVYNREKIVKPNANFIHNAKRLAEVVNRNQQPNSTLTSIQGITYLIGASPISNSAGDAEISGTIIFARVLDEVQWERITDLAQLKIEYLDHTPDYISSLTKWESILGLGNEVYTRVSADYNYGYSFLNSVWNESIVLVRVVEPRSLMKKGLSTRNRVTLFVLLFTLIALAATLYFLKNFILRPLISLGLESKRVGKLNNFEGRVKIKGDQEFLLLENELNSMLSLLSDTAKAVDKERARANLANRAKSIFIARVSHELRNPIGGIVGLNRLIKNQVSSKAIQKLIEMSDEAANSCLSVINEILDFSKAESGELTFEKIEFIPRHLLRETLQIMAARLEAKYFSDTEARIELLGSIASAVPEKIIGDPTKLRQVLINILSNSIKFTNQGYVKLAVNFESTSNSIVFNISDTGIGISADKLESIFVPYRQADESVAREYHGTGLGLSIVKQFVEGMGGQVGVTSQVGVGSTFWIRIPIEPSATLNEDKSLVKSCRLLYENELYCQHLMQDLKNLEVSVTPILTNVAQENLDLIRENEFLIISEVCLSNPVIKNCLLERAPAKEQNTAFVLSASNVALRDELYSAGFSKVYLKPILAEDLATITAVNTETVEPEAQPSLPIGKKLRILIADDLPTNRLILRQLLIESGHEVSEVTDGQLLLEQVSKQIKDIHSTAGFDLVITDITMPNLDGDAATRKIRELEKLNSINQRIPIVAVTGHAFQEELEKINQCGVDDVLVKPITPENLNAALKKFFN